MSTEPIPGEGIKAYRLFQEYLALGEARTVDKLSKQRRLSVSYIAKLATKNKWVDRCKADIVEQNERRKEAELEVLKEHARTMVTRRNEWRENAWRTHQALLAAANLSLRAMDANGQPTGKVRGGKVADAANLAKVADIMARIGADMPMVTRAEITGSGGRLLNPTVQPIITIRVMSDAESKDLLREARVNQPKE